jgi:hypothetical protein
MRAKELQEALHGVVLVEARAEALNGQLRSIQATLKASLTKVQMMIQRHMDEQDDRDPIAVGMCLRSLREVEFLEADE